MKRNNHILYFILFLMTIVFVGSMMNYCGHKRHEIGTADTIVMIHYDTIYNTIFKVVEKPIFKAVETIKHDTVYRDKDTIISLPVERKTYNDTVFFTQNDTVCIETTIIGINPSLERIKALLLKRQINQNTETIITKYKKKKGLIIAPTIGVGYGVFNKKPDVFAGIGITYVF